MKKLPFRKLTFEGINNPSTSEGVMGDSLIVEMATFGASNSLCI